MSDDKWAPLREWEPQVGEQVVEWSEPETVAGAAGRGELTDDHDR